MEEKLAKLEHYKFIDSFKTPSHKHHFGLLSSWNIYEISYFGRIYCLQLQSLHE